MTDIANTEVAKNTVKTNPWSGSFVWLFAGAFFIIAVILIGSSVPTINNLFTTYTLAGSTERQTELYFSHTDIPVGRAADVQFVVKNRENNPLAYSYKIIKSDATDTRSTILGAGELILANDQRKQVNHAIDTTSIHEKTKITVELSFVRPGNPYSESQEITQTIHIWIDGEAI